MLGNEVRAVPKPSHNRKAPKRGKRSEFPKKVKDEVFEKNGGLCEICGHRPISDFHHVKNRSQGGRGVITNCSGLCHGCHHVVTVNIPAQVALQKAYIERYGEDYYKDEWDH